MALKLFQINELISSTGLVQNATYEVGGIDKIRFITENAGGSNNFDIKVKIKGQTNFVTLGSITGNADKLMDIRTYDLMQIDCTVFDSPLYITLLGTGFQTGGTVITEYATFAEFPPATGSGDQGWDVSSKIMYYDSPSTQSWETGTASVVPLPSTQIAYGSVGNTVTGDTALTYNDVTETLSVTNLSLDGVSVGDKLYKPEGLISLTPTDITNKQITLSSTPVNASKTRLSIVGGVDQKYGSDFTVTGNTLSWNGLGLETILETGDTLIIDIN